jgi:hypothetical protein
MKPMVDQQPNAGKRMGKVGFFYISVKSLLWIVARIDSPAGSGPVVDKPKPKGPIKYPIDDLDVMITDRERKGGKQTLRPPLERDVPFGSDFEPFLMSWCFMQSFGCVVYSILLHWIVSHFACGVAEPCSESLHSRWTSMNVQYDTVFQTFLVRLLLRSTPV